MCIGNRTLDFLSRRLLSAIDLLLAECTALFPCLVLFRTKNEISNCSNSNVQIEISFVIYAETCTASLGKDETLIWIQYESEHFFQCLSCCFFQRFSSFLSVAVLKMYCFLRVCLLLGFFLLMNIHVSN